MAGTDNKEKLDEVTNAQEVVKKKRNKTFLKEKKWFQNFKKLLLQVATITLSVTISVWLNNLSIRIKNENEGEFFLQIMKVDLQHDIEGMRESKQNLLKMQQSLQQLFANTAKEMKQNSMGDVFIYLIDRKTHSGNFEGFKSAGKTGFIKNEKIRSEMMEYYEELVPQMEEVETQEKQITLQMSELMMLADTPAELLSNKQLMVKVNTFRQFSDLVIINYNTSTQKAEEIIKMIDKDREED